MAKVKSKYKFKLLKSMLLRLLLLVSFIAVLLSVIAYARGYRPDFQSGRLTSTGILATSSSPKAAKVFINGVLKGVTDLNLTLPPEDYTIEFKKEGYTDWKKQIKLKGEIVMSVDGLLFPKNPSLSPVTSLGIVKALPVDQTDRIILVSHNNDIEKDGLYIFDMNRRPLSLLPPLKSLLLKKYLPETAILDKVTVFFSNDYRQGIFEFPLELGGSVSYLLSLDEENTQLFDITASRDALMTAWKEETNKELLRILETFPRQIDRIASDSFRLISFSPDETKLLYQAKKSASLPRIINPPLIGTSQAPEVRDLEANAVYVYDKKEDKNFKVEDVALPKETTPSPTSNIFTSPTPRPLLDIVTADKIHWYPDSRHFVLMDKKEIIVKDYDDGGNKRIVYSGPIEENFFHITNEGKLLVITNLNPQYNKSPDLYEVGIR